MNDRRKIILFAIVIMATVSRAVAGSTIYVLYRAAFAEEEGRLVETVKSQARLIEAIARFHAGRNQDERLEDMAAATLRQLIDAHEHYEAFAETGEFAVAQKERDMIVFLISHRHSLLDKMIPFDSNLAEPMRLTLAGDSGVIVGPDYRGVTVLAA